MNDTICYLNTDLDISSRDELTGLASALAGSKPWAFNQGLSSELLGRMAAIGASLRVTLYPPERAQGNDS